MQCPAASVSDLLGELIFGKASGVSLRKATNAAETARNAFICGLVRRNESRSRYRDSPVLGLMITAYGPADR